MTKDDRDVVSAVRDALAGRVGIDRFELWFAPRTRIDVRGSTVTIQAGNRFSLEWLREQFGEEITAAAQDAVGKSANVRFLVNSSLGGDSDEAEQPAGAGDGQRAKVAHKQPPSETSPRQERPSSGLQRQLAEFGSFIVGDGNRVAIKAAEMVARTIG